MFSFSTTHTKRLSAVVLAFVLAVVLTGPAASLFQINQGGTGASTAAGAFLNLAPASTAVGDMIYCSHVTTGVCDTWSKLPANTSGTQWLQQTSAGIPSWTSPPGAGMVYPGAGIGVSNGSAWVTSYTLGTGLSLSGSAITTVGQQPAQITGGPICSAAICSASQVMLLVPVDFAISIPASCTGSHMDALTAATGSTVFTLYYRAAGITGSPTSFGTATFSASGQSASFTCTAHSFSAGDYFEILGPVAPDATLQNIAIGLLGTR